MTWAAARRASACPQWVRSGVCILSSIVCLAAAPSSTWGQAPTLGWELELGPVWQSYNDAEVPNDGTATRLSLRDLAGSGPWSTGRVYVTWNLSGRHGLRGLIAPLTATAVGHPAGPIRFADVVLEPDVPTRVRYTFNSYRLSYQYHVRRGDRVDVWVGATAKVRDAVIRLEQEGVVGRKDNLGFVPLLHAAGSWVVGGGWRLRLDADALAGGPGRAIDATARLDRRIGQRWRVGAGYRTVEGGADVPDVYTFAWFHYAALTLAWYR